VRRCEGRPEIQVHLDRVRAAELGVSAAELSGTVRTALTGTVVARLYDENRSYPIRLELDPARREGLKTLRQLIVARAGLAPVYLSDVATLRHELGPTQVERVNRERRIVVTADLRAGVSLGHAQKQVEAAFGKLSWGSAHWLWGGDVEDM